MRRAIFYISLLAIILSFGNDAFSQQRKVLNLPTYDEAPYHFGFILGINHMLFSIKTVDSLYFREWDNSQFSDLPTVDSLRILGVSSTPTPGFTIGILANLRLGKYGEMRFIPSLSFGERVLHYHLDTWSDSVQSLIVSEKSITSTLIDFPLEFRYKSKRLNNFRAYILAGVHYTLDLASQKRQAKNESDLIVKINKHDLLLDVGMGVEFYTTYFKFGTQIKMGYGLNNLVKYEDNIYTNSIESLRSKVFLLSFTFE